MVSIIVIAVLLVAVGFLSYWVIKSLVSPKKIDGIKKLLKQGKFVAAERMAKSIIAKDPRDFLAHYYLGKAYLADNKSELALMEFRLVNQNAIFGPELPELEFRQQVSKLYMKFNQPQEALKEYLLFYSCFSFYAAFLFDKDKNTSKSDCLNNNIAKDNH